MTVGCARIRVTDGSISAKRRNASSLLDSPGTNEAGLEGCLYVRNVPLLMADDRRMTLRTGVAEIGMSPPSIMFI